MTMSEFEDFGHSEFFFIGIEDDRFKFFFPIVHETWGRSEIIDVMKNIIHPDRLHVRDKQRGMERRDIEHRFPATSLFVHELEASDHDFDHDVRNDRQQYSPILSVSLTATTLELASISFCNISWTSASVSVLERQLHGSFVRRCPPTAFSR